MNSRFNIRTAGLAAAVLITLGISSCVKVDYELGANLIPYSQLFDIYSAEFPITDINLKMLDSLSGFSSKRITIGAIRDEEYGLTTRGCAMTLFPISDTLNFGKNPEFKSFRFTAAFDTTNVADRREANILQNINVYELSEPMDFEMTDLNASIPHRTERITEGIPVYGGKDSLRFNFNRAFGEKFMKIEQSDLQNMDRYLKKFPGIYIDTDIPEGIGGRINMFQLQLGINTSYGVVTKDFAELSFTAEYEGKRKDTSFLFLFSPTQICNLDSLITVQKNMGMTTYEFPQACFNATTHQTREREGRATDKIYIEGGGGLKAVISAQEIVDKIKAEVSKNGNPAEAIINRASIVFPFEFPDNYKDMTYFPDYLSPTCRMRTKDDDGNKHVSYASLTDVSTETEDPGKLNRSLLQYAPDITYHVQKLLGMPEDIDISNYDIWTLLMSKEVRVVEDDSESQYNDYLSAMMMQQYYNQLYGYGGYGGYGYGGYGYPGYGYGYGGYGGYGYGGYGYGYGGYGYGNYMNMYYAAAMAGQSSSGTTRQTTVEMDKDRYFRAILNGPEAENGRVPMMKIVYALPKGE